MPSKKRTLRRVPRQVAAGFFVLTAMVVASFLLTLFLARQTTTASAISDYRRAVTDVLNAARDAETAQRGYLITGDPAYLAPYQKAVRGAGNAVDVMERQLGERSRNVGRELRPLMAAKLAELQETVQLRQAGDQQRAIDVVRSGRGKAIMDRMRVIAERERAWSITELKRQLAQSYTALTALVAGLAAGALAVILMSLLWLRDERRQFALLDAARADAEGALTALKAENAGRESAEAQVRQMQKTDAIGQLTGGIAHDFNNMLAVVLGGIELAKRRLRSDPDKDESLLDNAREGATRAATLTARLLAFSRSQPLAPTPLDINTLVGGMCDMLGRTLGESIQVECVYAAGLWRCYADPAEVENAVLNLAINARDAMAEHGGGKLTVETANAHIDDQHARSHAEVAAGQYVLVCVTDTGGGMAPDVVDRAFDPFFTTKPVGKGTGLGLSQVFDFAKQSGGHVAIYSEVGQGTTVKLYLPRFTGAESGEAATVTPEAMPVGKREEIILVVEDETRVRHFAVDALGEIGYTAIAATSPAEALLMLQGRPEISMLFTDIVMPGMTGRQLADAARETRPDLKILYTTGYTRNAVVHNGMVDVGVALLAKPYSMGDLARKIRDVLDGGGVNRTI